MEDGPVDGLGGYCGSVSIGALGDLRKKSISMLFLV